MTQSETLRCPDTNQTCQFGDICIKLQAQNRVGADTPVYRTLPTEAQDQLSVEFCSSRRLRIFLDIYKDPSLDAETRELAGELYGRLDYSRNLIDLIP